MKLCPKIVGIVNKQTDCAIRIDSAPSSVECTKQSEMVRYDGWTIRQDGNCKKLVLTFTALKTGRGLLGIRIDDVTYTIPVVVFNDKEFFVSAVISSNHHTGYDPHNGLRGKDWNGKTIHGHAFVKALTNLVPVYHDKNIPITWLIDGEVAKISNQLIKEWHIKYGDDIGFMPPSYVHYNNVNYNLVKSYEETKQLLEETISDVEQYFPFYSDIAGIDQWIGSVGTNFTKACIELGFKGLWGVGYDHFSCDTSMFHRGCPWDAYKPSLDDFRRPSKEDSDLWIFQWTTRDIINTVHTPSGHSGSVIFSTDPDDILHTGIMDNQKDYYNKLLEQYRNNMDQNDFFIFLLHQEDHDSGHVKDNVYLTGFLNNIEGTVTYATLYEIAQWLNLKYAKSEHPSQKLYLQDILTCKDYVVWGRGGVVRPDDWPTGGAVYPDHMAYYDRDCQVIFQYPSQTPLRVFNYAKAEQTPEDRCMTEEVLPNVSIENGQIVRDRSRYVYQAQITSDGDYESYPLALWGLDEDVIKNVENTHRLCKNNIIMTVNLHKGTNDIAVRL